MGPSTCSIGVSSDETASYRVCRSASTLCTLSSLLYMSREPITRNASTETTDTHQQLIAGSRHGRNTLSSPSTKVTSSTQSLYSKPACHNVLAAGNPTSQLPTISRESAVIFSNLDIVKLPRSTPARAFTSVTLSTET